MARNVNVTKKEAVRKDVVFNKQRVENVTIVKDSDSVILSGKVILFSDEHDYTGSKYISLDISEYKKTEGEEEDLKTEIVPAVTVQDVIDGIENFEKEKPDLTKLKLDDFLASIVHENLA
ncbi:MAG: hypothetical protein BAJALOKI1v1_2690001 [Promethearchaeota archaeon]|nr:MAG: hypothetical protein BAJALOKI1v1_2690001 [Candidatus Lokiarchaeota archaeon]